MKHSMPEKKEEESNLTHLTHSVLGRNLFLSVVSVQSKTTIIYLESLVLSRILRSEVKVTKLVRESWVFFLVILVVFDTELPF